jgi:hypothetical protein
MPKRKPATVDFDDAESVKLAMAKELDVDPSDINIEEAHYSDFTGDTYYRIDFGGNKEYFVAKDNDSAYDLAVAMVKQDLEENPEIFNQSFIESHIDTDRLRRDLESDVSNSNYEYFNDMRDSELEREVRDRLRLDDEDFLDEDGEFKNRDGMVEKLAEDLTEEQLKDPMSYLEDIYGKEDAVKQAIKIAGIDVKAAAEEAVDSDGMGHFLSSYDGEYREGPDGIIWWRHN